MGNIQDMIRNGDEKGIWEQCCGFVDLSIGEFMEIQYRLLREQIELLRPSKIGQKIMKQSNPSTVEEFRDVIPFTSYEDYCPELLEKQEDALPAKAVRWAHTSGKSGAYRNKWVPISEGTWEELGNLIYGASILATCKEKGKIPPLPRNFLYVTANTPYTTGVIAYKLQEEFGYRFFPPLDEGGQMTFLERIESGINMALAEGIDGIYGFTNILVAIGERIKSGSGNSGLSTLLKNPKALPRVLKAVIKSKLAGRPMLPRDLWKLKGIVCGGADSSIMRERILEMWGVQPLDIYASTEALIVASQTWDYEAMTFNPYLNFMEFIPEAEYFKWKEDDSYEMKTLLLDELEAGGIYELVITNLHGGPLMRYRTGDMIKIQSLRNEKLDIDIPQMTFDRRADDIIFIGSLFRLTETVIWKAIERSDLDYTEWVARKEILEERPVLHIYLELKEDGPNSVESIEDRIYEEIKKLDDGFIHNVNELDSMEELLNLHPIKVTLLSIGSFNDYSRRKQAQGVDLAQLKPPRINPGDEIVSELLGEKVKMNQEVPKI